MQLICHKKELLGRKARYTWLTFYCVPAKISTKIFCQFNRKHTFATEMIFILSKTLNV